MGEDTHARPTQSSSVLALVFSAQLSGVSSSALTLVASARRIDVTRIVNAEIGRDRMAC